jgi:ubiquinol-cytochrome c reductase iron-sulfur subunit
MTDSTPSTSETASEIGTTSRRDFLTLTAGAAGVVGIGAAIVPFVNSMNPAADVLALSTVDVDIKALEPGQTKVVVWRGKPVFVRHRTDDEINQMKAQDIKQLKDPQTDLERFKENPAYLVVIGVCTHLGCIPGERKKMSAGENGGWLCACHGSLYDESGRILKGPAPKNLEVPPYKILDNNATIRIG